MEHLFQGSRYDSLGFCGNQFLALANGSLQRVSGGWRSPTWPSAEKASDSGELVRQWVTHRHAWLGSGELA